MLQKVSVEFSGYAVDQDAQRQVAQIAVFPLRAGRVGDAKLAWRALLSCALLAVPIAARASAPSVGDRGEVPSRHGPGERRHTLPALDAKLFDAAQRGCKKNDQASCVKLGRHLEEGVGTNQDKSRALELYRGATAVLRCGVHRCLKAAMPSS